MKYKRSMRIILMTEHLLSKPNVNIPLTYFAERFGQAKSSISEDVQILKETFESNGIGLIKTSAGASGGVLFQPKVSDDEAKAVIDSMCSMLSDKERLLPGGYLFMSDIVGNPSLMHDVGRLFATVYQHERIDVVVTIATKGITIANAVGYAMNCPVAVIRKDNKVTEGSTVSINYVSGSTRKIETMVLSKRTLKEGSNVLIVDDFLRAGGSINGVIHLMNEFKANVVGIGVLAEVKGIENRLIDNYVSLVAIEDIDEFRQQFTVDHGNYLTHLQTNK